MAAVGGFEPAGEVPEGGIPIDRVPGWSARSGSLESDRVIVAAGVVRADQLGDGLAPRPAMKMPWTIYNPSRSVPATDEGYIPPAPELGKGVLKLEVSTRPLRDKYGKPIFQVSTCRPCRRIGPDGQELTDVVVEVIQRRMGFFDEARQAAIDARTGNQWSEAAYDAVHPDFSFRGGCTLIIDPKTGTVRYSVSKPIKTKQDDRLAEERKFRQGQFRGETAAFLDPREEDNPFAALHADR